MGHSIEYIAKVPESRVYEWVATLEGFSLSMEEPQHGWEGELAGGGAFWVHSVASACNFVLVDKETWLLEGHPPTVEFVKRFESEFWKQLGPIPLLRIGELLREMWEGEKGCAWWECSSPFDEALAWLNQFDPDRSYSWELLSPPERFNR